MSESGCEKLGDQRMFYPDVSIFSGRAVMKGFCAGSGEGESKASGLRMEI